MKSIRFLFLVVVLFSLLLNSCVSKTEVLYFQDIENIQNQVENLEYKSMIRPNDLLSIVVSASISDAVAPYNPTTGSMESGEDQRTYLVDKEGNIDFPLEGKINVGYKSRSDVLGLLYAAVGKNVKNPVINLRILNYKISVLGEVHSPGTFIINDERVSILDALGLAGDMTIFGNRKSVKIIRENNEKKEYGELDFTSIDIINSPYYYLQQNDVVYVSPNSAQIQSAAFNRNSSIFISLAGIIITVIAIFTR